MAEHAATAGKAAAEQHGHSPVGGIPQNAAAIQDVPTTSSSFQAINTKPVIETMSPAVITEGGSKASDAATSPTPQTAPQTSSDPSRASQPQSQLDGAVDAGMAADTATYGTRSRNRTGNPRPNYAEDQDMDFEYSSTAASKKKPAMESAASTAPSAAETKRAPVAGLASNGNSNVSNTAGGGKELTPGLASKKRKAVGAPAITQTPPTSNSPAPTATRKPVAPSTTARETNIMSFAKHRSCLNKKGELIADDGTRLVANGKPASPLKVIHLGGPRPLPRRAENLSTTLRSPTDIAKL